MNIHKSQSSRAIYTSVQRVARSRAEAAAVVFGSRIVTYGELLELADRLAARLAAAFGDESHRLVAILGSAQPEFIACILAVLRNGWTYLPLVTSHPRIRNDAIIEDAGADAMMILGPNGEVELTGTRSHALDPEDQEKLKDRVYVMYTSGSTGSPKGSAASVAAVLNVIDFMRRKFAFNESSSLLGVTNFAWDLSVPDIYLPISTGGRLVLATSDELGELAAIASFIDRYDIDLMQASPSMWKLIVGSGWTGRAALTAVTGGEALPQALARELIPRCRELWNFYGPAECTVWSTCGRVLDPDRISLGFALPGVGLHVLREDDKFAAPGETGEIVISGIGVANGYLHRPALNAEKFISLDTPDGKIASYRTGDLGCLTQQGELFFEGRRDLMLKIRGHRVEPREIESHLERHPAIRQAVVFGRSGDVSDTLCAVLVTSTPLDATAVRAYLHERVPEFMIPSEIELRRELPLNANMKLDRMKVATDFRDNAHRASAAPRDFFELELLQILSEISNAPVNLDDPLFDGALHSLAVIRLLQRINKRIDGALTFADLQQNPTITHLAAFLRRAKTSGFRQLVEMRPGTTRRTVVFFHPGGGTCIPYKPLIDALPPELTVYGVECPNLYRPQPELFSIEEMAEQYYPHVARIDAEGPIGLGGWSLGGYIGYEIARRMRAEGRRVGMVLLMDSVIIDDQLQEFARIVGKPNVSEFLRGHFSGYWEYLNDEERERQRAMHELALDITLAYRPGPYEGDIVLAKAGKFDELPPDSDLDRMQRYVGSLCYNGWEVSCSGAIRVARMPTKHNDLISDTTAPLLAKLISEHLR
jgi:amino acid adenylation domain-containing protein